MKRAFVLIPMAAFASVFSLSPATAGNSKFFCGSWEGVPTTLASTKKGSVPVIRWVSDAFSGSGFDPQTRCEIVSQKFQESHEAGTLKYLTTGRKNGQNIVCVAKEEKGACSGQLFTLKPGSNPGQTLQQLMDVRDRAGGPLNESTARVYIGMDEFLLEAEEKYGEDTASTTTEESNESAEDSVW